MANATTKPKLELAGTDRPAAARRSTHARASGQVEGGWGAEARRFVRNNPAAVLIGAFVIGIALGKVARHA